MELGLSGKVAIVTGGTKGIGLACARCLIEEGARVGITSRSQANLDVALGVLGNVAAIAADLTDADAAARMASEMERVLGPIDILINCAGAARRRPWEELSPSSYREGMNAKFLACMNVADPVIKRMAARGSGVIVNVIGAGGKVASPIHLAGGAANAALMLATVGLAGAYAGRGVRVVGLNPGLTNTERVADGLRADATIAGISEAEALRRQEARIALGRMATPEEIASAAVFLASSRASYLTAVNITMDGGRTPVVC